MGREVTPLAAGGFCARRLVAGLTLALVATGAGPVSAFDGPSPGAATATSLTLPDGPASVRGLADAATVDVFTAQVNYAIPIELPKGSGGFGPSLTLKYDGDLGNGPLGVGWSLDTIMVKRSERLGVPTFTDNDELDLVGIAGGGRLIRDPDNTNPQVYWVEGKGTSIKVIKSNARFEVTDSNGTRYFLGNSSGSREEQGKRVSTWMVDWAVDVAGNEVDFTYTKASNRLYLANMSWGPQQNGTAAFGVAVDYEARPDIVLSYRAGFPISTASRVTDIRVLSFGRTLRTYTLTYDQTFALSRLVEVDQTGLDGLGSLPPVKLTYGGILQPEMVNFAATDGWTLNQRGVLVADVNGDGMADLLRLEAGDPEFLEGRGNYFAAAQPLSGAADFGLDQAALIDLDGDSRPELVHVVDDTWRAFSLSGTNWEPMGEWTGTDDIPLKGPNVVLSDLNGDGKIDAIRPRGSGGINVNFGGVGGLGPTLELPPLSANDVAVVPGDPNTRFIDINGDGLVDVVWVTDSWMKIFLGQGDGTFVPFIRAPYPWGASAGVDLASIMFADLNRDGLADLIRVDAANVTWFRGETDGRFGVFFRHLTRPESVDADAVVTIADMNGNGSQDVVWSSPRGLWALDLAGATSAGMITQIDNGLGTTTTFTYDASGSIAVAAERSGAPWQVLLPTSVPVPVTVEVDPGAGGAHRVTKHVVRDGFWDGVERRLGGFLVTQTTTVATNPADSTVVETRFLEGTGSDRELRGKPYFVRSSGGDGTTISIAKMTWNAVPVVGLPASPLTAKAAQKVSQLFLYEGLASPLEIRSTYQFDGEVRPIVESHLGRVDVAGDEVVVHHVYQSNTQANDFGVRDRDCEDLVYEGNGVTLVSDVQRLYGDSTATILPLGQVGKGWLRVEQDLLAAEARYVPQKTMSYDSFGNPVSTMVGGVTRDIAYDTMGLFPVGESIEHTNPLLAWSATWDDVRGKISTMTDPNGDVTTVGYDALARPVSLALNGLPPHVHYAYQWTPPLPSTSSWVFDGDGTALATEGPTWPSGSHWRVSTSVTNGVSEALYTTTSDGGQFILSGWKQRDERGKVVQTAEPFYISAVPTVGPPLPPSGTRFQNITYDSQGRVVLQMLPNGATKTTSYHALGQTVTSSELGPVSSETDGLMRIVHTERDPGTGVIESVDATYDGAGRITSMRLQGGQVVSSFAYDTLGRLTSADDPDVGPRQLVYNDANQLVQYTNGVGQSVYFGYDAAGRLTRRGETPAPSVASDDTFVYDSVTAALSTGCQVLAQLSAVTEPQGSVQFCYDALGRQVAMGRTVAVPDAPAVSGSKAQSLSFSGLLLSETFDDGFNTTYQYDGAGRAVSVSSDGAPLWTADQLDAAGRVVSEHYGNGASEAYQYDPLGLASRVTVNSPGSQTSLYDVVVQRNSYGAPTLVTDQDGQGLDQTATYSYDGAGRLKSAAMSTGTGQYAFGYQYDGLQNITLRTATGPSDIGILAGTYRYGERGYGPRQLTSVVPGGGP